MLVGSRPHIPARLDWAKPAHFPAPAPPLTGAEIAVGQLHHVFHAATEPVGLATMAMGSLAFGLGRWATVRGFTQWTPRLWQARPLTSHLAAAAGGLALEAGTFTTFPRLLSALKITKSEEPASAILHDLTRTALLLGMLRTSGFAGALVLQGPAAQVFGVGARAWIPPAAMGVGIYGNLWLEERLGWRADQGGKIRFWDSLGTLAQFQAAGTMVHGLLGPGYLQIQNHFGRKVNQMIHQLRLSGWGNGLGGNFAWASAMPGVAPPFSPAAELLRPGISWVKSESGDGSGKNETADFFPPPPARLPIEFVDPVSKIDSSEPPPPETIHFELLPGMNLGDGRYTVMELLGQGGMGEVWKLQDHHLNREVVTKILRPELRGELLPRFESEYRLQAHLPREWRVDIYEILQLTKGLKVPVMEYVPGRDISSLVYWLHQSFGIANEAYPIARRIEIVADICEAIHATHELGILHRDLKPENIRLTQSGNIRILDYGVWTWMKGGAPWRKPSTIPPPVAEGLAAHPTKEGQILGTPGYIAPEIVKGGELHPDFDPRQGDVFSLGVTLFEMITGHHPFGEYRPGDPELGEKPLVPIHDSEGYTKVQPHRVLDLHYGIAPPSFTSFHPGLDSPLYRRLEKVTFQAMSPDPKERFPSAQALRHALLMVEPEVRFDRLDELKNEIQQIEEQLRKEEPPFRRTLRKVPQEGLRLTQSEQRARYLRETWWEEGESLLTHLLSLTHREDFPAAQHMVAKISWAQLVEGGSRLHPVRRSTRIERIMENDVPFSGYSQPVMARALREGAPVQIRVHPLHDRVREIDGVKWKIVRLEREKDSHGDETGNFIEGRSISLDPRGVLPALSHGYYVFEVQAPGYRAMNVPIHLGYEKLRAALEQEKAISFDLEMIPEEIVPKDMVVIHRTRGFMGHNFYLDGDTASANSFPMQRVFIPTVAVSKDPISVGDYRLFIEDLLAENRRTHWKDGARFRAGLEEIEALIPKTTVPSEARGKGRQLKGLVQRALGGQETTLYWQLVRERKFFGMGPILDARLIDPSSHEDPFGEPIHLDHPISAISPEAAMAYVRWRSKREGRPYEILDADTKEVISRNSFDTRYPWGNGPMTDQYVVSRGAFQDVSRATPQVIGTHPMGPNNYRDWSWYGARELIGNVREVTSTPGEPDHFCLSGGCVRMYLGANFNPSARYQTHRNAVLDSDGTFRLMLRFPEENR